MSMMPGALRGGQQVERYECTEPTVCGVYGADTLGCDTEHPAGTLMVRSLRPRVDGTPKPELCAEAYDRVYVPSTQLQAPL